MKNKPIIFNSALTFGCAVLALVQPSITNFILFGFLGLLLALVAAIHLPEAAEKEKSKPFHDQQWEQTR